MGAYAHIDSRYRRLGGATMDESLFPIRWAEFAYRTPFLEAYLNSGSGSRAR